MKPAKSRATVLLTVALALFTSGEAAGQIMGPLLPEGAMELGPRVRWVQADMEWGMQSNYVDQYDVTVPLRFGVTRFATLSAELFIGDQDMHSREAELRYYTLGGGFQTLVWEKDDYIVSGGVHFVETLIIDKSGNQCDREQFALLAIMQVQRNINYWDQELVLWGGVVQYYFSDNVEGGNQCKASGYNNSATLGGALGANLLLYDHYQLYYHFIYVDYYQPHIGLSYRF